MNVLLVTTTILLLEIVLFAYRLVDSAQRQHVLNVLILLRFSTIYLLVHVLRLVLLVITHKIVNPTVLAAHATFLV